MVMVALLVSVLEFSCTLIFTRALPEAPLEGVNDIHEAGALVCSAEMDHAAGAVKPISYSPSVLEALMPPLNRDSYALSTTISTFCLGSSLVPLHPAAIIKVPASRP